MGFRRIRANSLSTGIGLRKIRAFWVECRRVSASLRQLPCCSQGGGGWQPPFKSSFYVGKKVTISIVIHWSREEVKEKLEKRFISLSVILIVFGWVLFPGLSPRGQSVFVHDAYAQNCKNFKPTHRTEIDLWVRSEVPSYSFRTGKWILGQEIGMLPKGTEIQEIGREVVGFTQLWLCVCFKLPNNRIAGGRGHWIWAGRVDSMENVRPLHASSGKMRKVLSALSLINHAWAQGDTIPGLNSPQRAPGGLTDTLPREEARENRDIYAQLNNWRFITAKYLGIYLFLLFGMMVGSTWDWLNLKAPAKSNGSYLSSLKPFLKIVIGSLISFSFFIGPIMGIGELGLTFSSAILAFHFGLVHYDPTELILGMRSKVAVREDKG